MSSEAATLGVTLNRERLNEALAPESFAADEEFAVRLRNEGEPVHVHLRFTGPVADATAVETSNHYVDAATTLSVPVRVARVDAPVEGTLRVITGHGAEGTEVAVRVEPPPEPVDVDESYANPPRADTAGDGGAVATPDEDDDGGPLVTLPSDVDLATVAVAGVAVLALLGAVAVALVLNSLAVTLGVVAVFVAVAVAVVLLLR